MNQAAEDAFAKARVLAAAKFTQRCRRAARDLPTFVHTVAHDDHGKTLVLETMQLNWIKHIEYCWARNLKAMVLAHFASGKSSSLAVPLIAFKIGGDPNLRIKVVTNDDGNAVKRVVGVARMIESPIYQHVFKNARKGTKWTEHELFLRRGGSALDPSIHARGVMTRGVGGRADLIIFDDVVDQVNSLDVAQRKKVLEFIDLTWLSRLEPDGKVLWIATIWHGDDATHHFMQRPGWCTLIQRVPDDYASRPPDQVIDQELIGAPDPTNHPIAQIPSSLPNRIGA